MAHKPNSADVRRAFERYQRVSGDVDARLERTAQEPGPTIWRLEGDWRGEWYGSGSAFPAIEAYCDGYRDGHDDGFEAGAKRDHELAEQEFIQGEAR
jgi:hypothetical protein